MNSPPLSATELYKRLLGYADKMLDLADEVQTVITDTNDLTGLLTISAPETLCAYRNPSRE